MPDAFPNQALLPQGFTDLLAEEFGGAAGGEARLVQRCHAQAALYGYTLVKPPLLEFESSLLAGPGAALAAQTFRLMDPVSQEMLALRSDLTPQIARMAATRLADVPRPLRLCYAGEVLRTRAGGIRTARQFRQWGVELFGSFAPEADAELIRLALACFAALDIPDVVLDFSLPTLLPALLTAQPLPPDVAAEFWNAAAHKDVAAMAALALPQVDVTCALMEASGPPEKALAALYAMDLPAPALADRTRLAKVMELLADLDLGARVSVDLTEQRGFEYHTGLSVAFFAPPRLARAGVAELGRGGRYRGRVLARTGEPAGEPGGEPAVGFSLYLDSLLKVLPPLAPARRVFAPAEIAETVVMAARAQGLVVVRGLPGQSAGAARSLGCVALLQADGGQKELGA